MKKLIYMVVTVLIAIFITSFIIIEALIIAAGRSKSIGKADYIIILGAKTYGDKPSPALLRRLKASIDYLLENDDIKVIVSGGQDWGSNMSEAKIMRDFLVDNGIDSNKIVMEDKSTTTFENLQFSSEKIKELDNITNPKVLIATNNYHMYRAKLLAKKLGMDPYGLSEGDSASKDIKPYIREYFAVMKTIFLNRRMSGGRFD